MSLPECEHLSINGGVCAECGRRIVGVRLHDGLTAYVPDTDPLLAELDRYRTAIVNEMDACRDERRLTRCSDCDMSAHCNLYQAVK